MNSIYTDVWRLWKEQRYLQAVELAEHLESRGEICPETLVIKGICIQLIKEDDAPFELIDAERAFKDALGIEPNFVPALVELGYYYLNVADNAAEALPLFEKALSIEKRVLNQATEGLVRSMLEMTPVVEVRAYLESVVTQTFDHDRFKRIFDEGIWT